MKRVLVVPLSTALAAIALAGPSAAQSPLLRDLHQPFPADDEATVDIAVGDLDGDGFADLVLVDEGVSDLPRVYRNLGDGRLGSVGGMPGISEFRPRSSVALGDLDGDGDLDAFLGLGDYFVAGQNQLLLNDGAALFTNATATGLPVHADRTYDVALADVDLDGALDVFVANRFSPLFGTQHNHLLHNLGGASFEFWTQKLPLDPLTAFSAGEAAFLDAEGDGDPDLLLRGVAYPPTAFQTYLWRNDGTGTFTDSSTDFPQPGTDGVIAVADVDGDGDVDALFGGRDLYRNDGNGVFTLSPGSVPDPGFLAKAATLGDYDGDGDVDLLRATGLGLDGLCINVGGGQFVEVPALPPGASTGETADFLDVENDGDLDAVFGDDDRSDRLFLNDGALSLALPPTDFRHTVVNFWRSLAVFDADGDEDLDLVFGGASADNALFLGDGTGFFQHAPGAVDVGLAAHMRTLAAGDLDGDGDVDLVTSTARIWSNDGGGGFTDTSAANFPLDATAGQDVVLADVDGDGDPDALFAGLAVPGGKGQLYLNQAGVFMHGTGFAMSDWSQARCLVAGDVDLDGDLDVVLGTWGSQLQDHLALNDGLGSFTDAAHQMTVVTEATERVALTDLDADGDLDLVALGDARRVDRNVGAGWFQSVSGALPPAAAQEPAVAVGDVDEDGDPDLLVVGRGSSGKGAPNRLFLNDGSGAFAIGELEPYVEFSVDVALADLDRDGDLDAVVANEGDSASPVAARVLANLRRQLAWRRVPSVHQPYTLELSGPPDGAWGLAWSPVPGSLEIPGLGLLQLHTQSIVRVRAGTFDGTGETAQTFFRPNTPDWIGLSMFWQAVVGPPARYTNLEVLTFTTF